MYSDDFVAALKATGIPVAHFGWEKERFPAGNYIVYTEDGADDLEANGLHIERATDGTVAPFTRDYTTTQKALVEAVFEARPDIVWNLETIQFEEETKYVHYSWEVGQYGKGSSV